MKYYIGLINAHFGRTIFYSQRQPDVNHSQWNIGIQNQEISILNTPLKVKMNILEFFFFFFIHGFKQDAWEWFLYFVKNHRRVLTLRNGLDRPIGFFSSIATDRQIKYLNSASTTRVHITYDHELFLFCFVFRINSLLISKVSKHWPKVNVKIDTSLLVKNLGIIVDDWKKSYSLCSDYFFSTTFLHCHRL